MKREKFHISFKLQGESFQSVNELIVFSKTISVEITDFLKSWFDKKPYVEVKTSGSTGTPKTIQLQKIYMINSAKATGEFFNLSEGTLALLCMSPNFIAGKMMLVRALTLGWHLDVVAPVSNPLKNTTKKYDFAAMVPLQLNNSLTEIELIKKLIVGGGVVSKELLHKIQHIKTEIFATYGMTETITHIAVKKLNNFSVISSAVEKSYCSVFTNSKIPSQAENDVSVSYAEPALPAGWLVSASHYKTLPNIKISKDKRGCLVINAPNISSEEIITNDLVEIISDNEFKWLGRFDSIINSGGIKLIPEQIEEKLSLIVVNRFFVAGIPDTILGEKLILIVEGSKDNVILNVVQQLTTLSKYEIPKEIYFLNQFVETLTKKINRKETLKILAKDFNKH